MSTGTFALSGMGCLALASFLVHSPLLGLGLDGNSLVAMARDGLAGLLLLVIALGMRIPRRPGAAFGCLAALSLAPALSFLIAALLPMHPAVAVLGGLGLALLMIPVLRERGISSLILTSILVSLALVSARRQSLIVAEEVAEIRLFRAMIQEGGLSRHFFAVDEAYPLRRRRNLALSLWPEGQAQRIDLLCVTAGSSDETALLASGWRGLRVVREGYQIIEPQAQQQDSGIALRGAKLGPTGPDLSVRDLLVGSHLLRVLTPCGSLQQVYDHPGVVLQLSPELAAEYGRLIAGLPGGMPILLRLEASFGPARSAWTMLRTR